MLYPCAYEALEVPKSTQPFDDCPILSGGESLDHPVITYLNSSNQARGTD